MYNIVWIYLFLLGIYIFYGWAKFPYNIRVLVYIHLVSSIRLYFYAFTVVVDGSHAINHKELTTAGLRVIWGINYNIFL